jgi:WD40 repeat protein
LKDFRETIDNNDDVNRLVLVLDIFVQSKLVVDYKETSEKQYQLLHDYLSRLIREQSKDQEKWYRDKIEKISLEAANARAEASAAEARAAEAEARVKLEIDLDEANKAKEQAIHDREKAESAREQAEHHTQKARKKLFLVGAIGLTMTIGAIMSALAWMTSDRLTEENRAEIDGARMMKSFNSGYGNLENFFFRALQVGQKFKNLVQVNSSEGFDNYPTTTPLLALQQTFESIEQQDIYRYDLGKYNNDESINIMDVNLQPDTLTTIHTNGQILQRSTNLQGNYSKQKVKEIANISQLTFQGKFINLEQIRLIIFSPDRQKIALVIGKKVLIWKNWESSPKEPTYYYEHLGNVNLLKFSPDSKWLMTVSESQIILYDTVNQEKRKLLWKIEEKSASAKPRVTLEDVTSQRHSQPSRQSLGNPSSIILSADFSHDQKNNPKIALGFNSGEVVIVDLNNLAAARTIQPQGEKAVIALDFNLTTKLLAIGFEKGSLVNFDLTNNEMKSCPSEGFVFSKFEFIPDDILAIGYKNGLLKIINRECQKLFQFKAHEQEIQGLKLSSDHQWLTTNSELEVRRWKLDPRQEFAVNSRNFLNQASLSGDGQLLATATSKGIELWNLSGKKEPEEPFDSQNKPNQNTDEITSISFQPNNNQPYLLATGSSTGILSLWRLQSQTNYRLQDKSEVSVRNSSQSGSPIWSLTFSQDGSLLATGSQDGIIQIRNVAALLKNAPASICRRSINGSNVNVLSIAIRPDNQQIAMGLSNGQIYLLDLRNGRCLSNKPLETTKDFRHFAAVVTVQYIPYKDNQWLLATGSDDLTARLWSLYYKEKVRFEDHDGSVRGIAYLPKDKVLVTASTDRSVRLWTWKDDLESIDSSQPLSGELIAKHNGHIRPIRGIFFRDQPRQLISISTAPKIRFWPIPESKNYLGSLMDDACKEVPNMEENKQTMTEICSKMQRSEP